MDERSKRINDAIAQSGYSYPELSKITGVSKSSLQRYATGGTKKIPIDCVEAIAKATGTSAKYLMGWEESEISPLDELIKKHSNIKRIQKKKFPLLGEIACGEPIYADEDKESFVMADMDIDADFCLTAKGDSMINASIYDGDIVFIKSQPIVANGDIAAVIIDDEATLKRVYYYPELNKIILQSENPKYKPFVYTKNELEQIRILGKAVYFMREL